MIRNRKAGFVLGAMEFLAAFQLARIWSLALNNSTSDQFAQLVESISASLSFILLLLPIVGLFLVYHNKRAGYLLFAAFPLLSIVFGITAFPFVNYLYGNDVMLNSLFIAITNALVCAFAFWLYVSAKSHFPKASELPSSEKAE